MSHGGTGKENIKTRTEQESQSMPECHMVGQINLKQGQKNRKFNGGIYALSWLRNMDAEHRTEKKATRSRSGLLTTKVKYFESGRISKLSITPEEIMK